MFKRVLFIASLLFSISFSVRAVTLKAYIKSFQTANNCTYQIFNFQDSSSYNGANKSKLKYKWDFGDATTDTGKTVTKYYTATGNYTLKLVVTDATDGLADSTTKIIAISGTGVLPVLNYTGLLCERSEISFSIKTTFSNTAYNTNFGDGNNVGTPANYSQPAATPGIHVYQTRGTYNVVVRDSNSAGCKSQITVPITILQRPFARQPVPLKGVYHCQDSTLTLTAAQNSVSDTLGMRVTYLWKFPDKTTYTTKSVTKLFKDSGSFQAKLFLINNSGIGCSDSVNFNYTVYSNPSVKFYMVPHCQDSIGVIYDSSLTHFSAGFINSWHWAFYDSNFVKVDTAAGYTGLYEPASFNYGFPHGGTFYVTEYVKTTDGCFDSLQKKVYINPTPTPNFVFRNACVDSALQFTDSSTVPKGNTIAGWAWNFGDGGTSSLQNPAHQYAKFGYNYSVRLIAKTQAGCIDSVRDTVKAFPLPKDSFVFISECEGQKISFANSSVMPNGTDPNDKVTRDLWVFGDGTPNDTTFYPQHIFNDSGYQNVKLVSFSSQGCSDTTTQQVYVYPLPRPSFTLQNDCERDSVHFVNTSKAYDKDVLIDSSYTWNFGDTTAFANTITNPNHLYQHSDTFNVNLTAKTWVHGCIKDTTIPVVIIPGPHSSFTVGARCTGAPVLFTNHTFSADPGTIKYIWHFGDGTTDTVRNPIHTYSSTGNYRAYLTSYMPATGCTDSTPTQLVNVDPRPVVYFTANNACSDSLVNCADSSYVPGYKAPQHLQSWSWDFGDGNFASGPNVTHQYKKPGVYTIKEYVLSTSQCEDSFIRQVAIYKVPVANFSYSESCAGTPTPFTSLTTPADSVAIWKWVFSDDGADSIAAQNTTHIYNDNDVLDASLTVFTANGCPNTKSEAIQIYYSPVSQFTNTTNCNSPGEIQRKMIFTSANTGQPPAPNFVATWRWNFGDTAAADRSTDTSTTQNPIRTFQYAGNYNVILTETSNQGCVSIDTQVVVVPEVPIAGFMYTGSCVGRQFVFVDTSRDIPSPPALPHPEWYFGDGNRGVGKSGGNVNTYLKSGTYNMKMYEFVDYTSEYPQLTCTSDTAYASIVVNPLPLPSFSADTACFGDATTFYDSSQGNGGQRIVHYDWKFGDGTEDSITASQFGHAYKDSFPGSDSTYRVILKVTTNYGCDSSDTQRVFIRQKPYASFSASPDPAAIQHSQVTFTNTTLHADSNHYYWTFGDGTDSHGINPTHTYKDTGTYQVTLSADNDYCVDTSRYIVYVTPGYTLYAPNCITANGDKKNDSWMAKGVGVIDFDVVIADRWGQIVFHSEDINKPWNADYNGNGVKVPEGVYVYYIKAGDFSQTNFTTLKGFITVLR